MPARLSDAPLFRGIPAEEVDAMLPCLGASRRAYRRGERVMLAGQVATRVGMLLEGRLHVEMPDAWGNVSVLESVGPGEPFAVAYACGKEGLLDVDVVADADSTVATLEATRVLHPCERQCACHGALVRNLLVSMANKNIAMNRRAMAMRRKPCAARFSRTFPYSKPLRARPSSPFRSRRRNWPATWVLIAARCRLSCRRCEKRA